MDVFDKDREPDLIAAFDDLTKQQRATAGEDAFADLQIDAALTKEIAELGQELTGHLSNQDLHLSRQNRGFTFDDLVNIAVFQMKSILGITLAEDAVVERNHTLLKTFDHSQVWLAIPQFQDIDGIAADIDDIGGGVFFKFTEPRNCGRQSLGITHYLSDPDGVVAAIVLEIYHFVFSQEVLFEPRVKLAIMCGRQPDQERDIYRNLIQNSEDEISDSENRSTGNRMPTILKHVEEIIRTGEVRLDYERSLNPTQLQEEVDKLNWLSVHPEYSEDLFALEDHELLQGQISIVGLEHPEHFARFEKLFACDWDKVDCALMSIGFYGQQEKNRTHYQLGTKSKRNTKAWRSLFHRSNKSVGFDETKRILAELLSSTEEFNDTYLDNMAATYLDSCEQQQIYPWRYYYIKYDFFRPGSYGKYTWENYAEAPYHFSVMMTERKWSENTYQPFLRAIDESKLSREDMGQRLRLGNRFIVAENGGIVLYDEETRQELVRVHVPQNEDKIDVENRVESLKKAYTAMI